MDIQVSSNFERLLFELKGRSGAAVATGMQSFRATGALPADEHAWRIARSLFSAHKVDDTQTMQIMAETHRRTGVLIDPHTAVAVGSARAEIAVDRGGNTPMIALGCAHPAKFPDAVERATGIRPGLPPALGDLFERRERLVSLPNEIGAVTRFIRAHARRVGALA
jgi:threonine synthase